MRECAEKHACGEMFINKTRSDREVLVKHHEKYVGIPCYRSLEIFVPSICPGLGTEELL